MNTRVTITLTLDRIGQQSDEYMVGRVAGAFDYLNAEAEVVREPEADPMHPLHNEGEE